MFKVLKRLFSVQVEPGKCFYKVLGVDPKLDTDKIKIQYYKLAQKYHPDKNDGSAIALEKFKEISSAWDVIGDEN